MGGKLTSEEAAEVFGDFDPAAYEEEARERWGDTDAYRESARRTAGYGKDDWLRIKAEGEEVEAGLAEAMTAGVPADSEQAMDLAEAHRRQISQWFYDCSHDVHRGLADMYVGDPRFTAHYERRAEGLARYIHDAVHANAARAQAS